LAGQEPDDQEPSAPVRRMQPWAQPISAALCTPDGARFAARSCAAAAFVTPSARQTWSSSEFAAMPNSQLAAAQLPAAPLPPWDRLTMRLGVAAPALR
jgi:hypothetical protein